VAHAYKPSYLGGRDQEDPSSKPAQADSSQDPILKIPNTNGRTPKCEALSSNPSTTKKNQTENSDSEAMSY
jgi:hypothetical protein